MVLLHSDVRLPEGIDTYIHIMYLYIYIYNDIKLYPNCCWNGHRCFMKILESVIEDLHGLDGLDGLDESEVRFTHNVPSLWEDNLIAPMWADLAGH